MIGVALYKCVNASTFVFCKPLKMLTCNVKSRILFQLSNSSSRLVLCPLNVVVIKLFASLKFIHSFIHSFIYSLLEFVQRLNRGLFKGDINENLLWE